MALDAGSVFTILGGRFSPGAFKEFDAANKNSARVAAESEAQIAAAQGRAAKAHDATAGAAGRSAAANERLAKSGSRLRETLPLAAMGQLSKHSDEAQKNLSQLGNVAAKGAGVGILALGAATVYAATKATTFNREMLKISTQAGGSASEVKKLSSEVLAMAGTVPQGPQKLAEGLYHIESAGFRGTQALSMLKAAAQGAALGNADLQATTQAMIATIASQIKGVHGSADAMGQLNDIVGVGDMRMEQLAQAMATGLLPSAHDAGLSLKDVGAALATVTDNATPANVTATRLRMTIALLAAPSKAAVKQLESIGLTSTSLAHDMRQPNGLLLAVEDLKKHLHDSGKSAEEQDAILSHVFGGGKSSAVIHTLISETDRLRNKYDQLGASNGPAKLAKSWAEYQKSQSASFGELKSGAEAFAITVGNVVLPTLTKMAHSAAHSLDGFVQSGGAAKAGAAITSVFSTLGTVIGNVAPVIAGVARSLVEVGKAVGLGNAGELTALLAAFATFKGVSFVAPILASIAGAISEIGLAAATAPSLAAFVGDLVAMAGPAGLIAGGLALAAGAFVAFNSGLFDGASAAEKNAAALQRDKEAVTQLSGATDGAAKAHFAAQRATLAHKEAVDTLKRTEKEAADGTIKGAEAQDKLLSARLSVAESANQVTDAHAKAAQALQAETHQGEKAQKIIGSRQQETLKQIASLEAESRARGQRNFTLKNGESAEGRRNKLQAEYNRQSREAAQANAQVAVSEESRRRIEAGRGAITAQNAQGVQQLQNALFEAGAPKKIVTRYELDDQGAQAKLGALSAQLTALGEQRIVARVLTTAPNAASAVLALRAVLVGVPKSKVISILHNAPSARAAMGQLHSAISAVQSSKHIAISTNAGQARAEIASVQAEVSGLTGKSIQINVQKAFTTVETTIKKAIGGHASGRKSGEGEAAVVGEGGAPEYVIDRRTGAGQIVSRPTLMGLGADDYVVPLEERFRGRAIGLFSMLARDLEVPGYKKGKHPGGKGKGGSHHYVIPNAIAPLSLPLSDIESKQSTAKSAEEKAKTKVKSEAAKVASLEKSIRTGERAKKPNRAKLSELHGELKKVKHEHDADAAQLAKDKREVAEWARTVREAKAFQTRINLRTLEANNAGNAMKLAADHDDLAGYEAAKGKRLGALGALRQLISEAQKQVKSGSEYALQLEGQVQTAEQEEQTTSGEAYEGAETPEQKAARKAVEEEEGTGETAAERAEQKHIEAAIALAALTPDLGDDTQAAQQLVSFFSRVLGEVQAEPGPRGGDSSIASIAGSLKTAQTNLESLSGAGSNTNADLQAQITQANERAEQAKAQAQTAERALQVFGGSGDIGAGGSNAAQAARTSIVINTLHPGDPNTLRAIGDAATSGIGLQGSRQAVRVQVGP